MAAKKSAGKSMDVMKPGATAPESSGRPIVVTNRPIMQDPMVKDTTEEKSEDDNTPTPTVSSGSTKVIAPITPQELEKETDDPAAEKEEETGPDPEVKTSVPSPEEESEQAAVVDAVVASAGNNQTPQQQDEIAQDERKQRVQKLIDSKKYVVPIGQVNRKKLHQQLAVLVVFLVLVGGVYVAADMGYVPLPFDLPVHIVKH